MIGTHDVLLDACPIHTVNETLIASICPVEWAKLQVMIATRDNDSVRDAFDLVAHDPEANHMLYQAIRDVTNAFQKITQLSLYVDTMTKDTQEYLDYDKCLMWHVGDVFQYTPAAEKYQAHIHADNIFVIS